MTMTDSELRDALAPLAHQPPTEAEVAAVLAAAQTRSARASGRRRRLVVVLAIACVAAGVLSIALPGAPLEPAATHANAGVALLQTAAAAAAEQPPAPQFAGYRYTEMLEHWRSAPLVVDGKRVMGVEEVQQRVETWVDREWRGRRVAHRGRVIEGTARTRRDFFVRPSDRPYEYGDGPRPDVARLPTGPTALRDALLRVYRSVNWAPGHPTREQERFDLVYEVLILLDSANTTPAQRGGLWGVLALVPGVRTAPAARELLARDASTVVIPVRPDGSGGAFTVTFDPRSSELLSWSLMGARAGTPDQTHTILRTGHVAAIGDREPSRRLR
jgi:hypothetical protein